MGRNTRLAISLAASRGVHTPNDTHRQNHVRVLASLAEVAQYVVGDAPDEGDDLVVGRLIYVQSAPNRQPVRTRESAGVVTPTVTAESVSEPNVFPLLGYALIRDALR